MYQLAETKDSRIAQYTFGKSIAQFGVSVFSCTSARKGKKIFANDPDPLKEYVLDTQLKLVKAHIKKHPKGKAAGYKDIIKEIGPLNQVHHRTVMFGSTWKSDSLKPAGKSILYHNGSYTHFRYNGIARITSQEQNGIIACSGFEDLHSTNRKVHFLKKSDSFTPAGIGSIIVPMHDVWYHKTKLLQHYPFPISEVDTVQITVDKPTVIIEFVEGEPNVAEFTQSWLNQIEEGLIEIIDR